MRCSLAVLALLAAATAVAADSHGRTLLAPAPAPGSDGCTTVETGYQVILRTGNGPSQDTPLGLISMKDGKPLMRPAETSRKLLQTGERAVSANPDFSTLHMVDGKIYMVVQFESPQPSAANVIALEQDKATGKLTPTSVKPVDFSGVNGAWTMCSGGLSPWGSHLGGEEYEPDARVLFSAKTLMGENDSVAAVDEELADNVASYLRYFGVNNGEELPMSEVLQYFNPYNYGALIDIMVMADGSTNVTKYHTLGRTSKELCYVMPDNRTVYCPDDGTQVGFYKFVADKPSDLTSGKLYAGKFAQKDAENGGQFDVMWVELGSANNAELMKLANSTKFQDIFEYQKPSNGSCPDGFKSVNMGNYLQECLKLKPGMEKAAAFLETRRYAAYLGATTEFSKWEGITFSPSRKQLFTSMSEIRYGMEDNKSKGKDEKKYDQGSNNDIRLPYNPCGCVYALDVDSDYSATNMKGVLCGYLQNDPSANKIVDQCSVNGLGNPDNVIVMDSNDILIIGEDATTAHQNDLMWAYDLNNGNMARIFSTPYGSETTSPFWYPNFANGWSYLVGVVQHPYGESDEDKVDNPYSEGDAAYVGAWAFPANQIANKTLHFASIPYPKTEEEKSKVVSTQSVLACPKTGPQASTYITPEMGSSSASAPAPAVASLSTSDAGVAAPTRILLAICAIVMVMLA